MKAVSALCLVILSLGRLNAQADPDEAALRLLPQAFTAAFNKHDAHALAAMMTDDVDFVTVGLDWLHGRADFEKYHTRPLTGRFKQISLTVLETHVPFVRPDVAVVRNSWTVQGDKNADGSARAPRFGLATMVAEKRNGVWLVSAVQNANGPTDATASPEAQGITSPIVVPRPK